MKRTFYVPLVMANILAFILIAIGLTSCDEIGVFRKPKWVGVINNDTPYVMNITAYSKSIEEYSIEIGAGERFELTLSERDFGMTEGIFFKDRETAPTPPNLVDSVEIVFDHKKKLLQYCDGDFLLKCDMIPKSLLHIFWNTENQVIDKDGNLLFGYLYKYQITFTNEDYLSAIDF